MSITKAAMFGGELLCNIPNSVAISSESASYLSRTAITDADSKKWTFSVWVKRHQVSTQNGYVFQVGSTDGTWYTGLTFNESDELYYLDGISGSNPHLATSTAKFRDVSSWYHIVCAVDTTQTDSTKRVRIYVNNVEAEMNNTATYSQNANTQVNNSAYDFYVGKTARVDTYERHSNQYFSEVVFVSDEVLLPTEFGEKNSATGQWNPKKYSGSYGINGFYLDFQNSNDLGRDVSGNNNDWINNGVIQSTDTPTDNHCIWNSLFHKDPSITYENAGRTVKSNGGSGRSAYGSISLTSGKYYWEFTGVENACGIGSIVDDGGNYFGYYGTGIYYDNGSQTAGKETFTAIDIIGVAYDADAKTIEFYKNNVSQGAASFNDDGTPVMPWMAGEFSQTNTVTLHTEKATWAYSPPAGYKALSSKNLVTPAIRKPWRYFKTFTYTGNGAGLQVGYDVQDMDIYPLTNSSRMPAETQPYYYRNFDAGDRKTWTFSTWVKRTKLGSHQRIMVTNAQGGFGIEGGLSFTSSDSIDFIFEYNAGSRYRLVTNTTYKDLSHWYHLVFVADSANGSLGERMRLYVDGVRVTSFSTENYPAQSHDGSVNYQAAHYLGAAAGGGNYIDSYLAETHFADGQALSADDFGQKDGNGYWVPKQYTGSYGVNGFHFDYENSANLIEDRGGNELSFISSGASYQSTDNPSNNYAKLDANSVGSNMSPANITDAGKTISNAGVGAAWSTTAFTQQAKKGKFYFEVEYIADTPITYTSMYVGFQEVSSILPDDVNLSNGMFVGVRNDASSPPYVHGRVSNINTAINDSPTTKFPANTPTTFMLAWDMDNGKCWVGENGVWAASGDPSSGTNELAGSFAPSSDVSIVSMSGRSDLNAYTTTFRTEESEWLYEPPAGFTAFSSNNLVDEEAFSDSPDLVWIKNRDAAAGHVLFDTERGMSTRLKSDGVDAEVSADGTGVVEFNRSGFRLNGDAVRWNAKNNNYVSWVWKKGVIPGFDIVEYVGDGSASNTIPHSLGVVPDLALFKNLDSAQNWLMQGAFIGDPVAGHFLTPNDSSAQGASTSDNTFLTESDFTVDISVRYNQSGDRHIAYLWSEVEGFSKFGSYTGNGSSDGPFVHCGFRPAYVMVKGATFASNWNMFDEVTDQHNSATQILRANLSDTEFDGSTQAAAVRMEIDMLSNGFKIRNVGGDLNSNGQTMIFIAFAKAPFKYSRAR